MRLTLLGTPGTTRDFFLGADLYSFKAGVPKDVPSDVYETFRAKVPNLFSFEPPGQETKQPAPVTERKEQELPLDFLARFEQPALLTVGA